jgi:adenylate kinase
MKRVITLIALAAFVAGAALADNRMVVLLIGPPGAGKTTQSRKLSKKYGIPSIAMPDLLKKDAGWGKMGSKKIVKAEVESGELANDETADLLMRKRLLLDDAQRGFILDGYPATAGEADKLDALLKERGLPAPIVIYLAVPDDVARERMNRRHRVQDSSDMIERRLAEYHHESEFILGRYPGTQLHKIDGSGDEQHVWHEIEHALAAGGK